MTIKNTIAALKKTIPQHRAAFEAAKTRNPILSAYETAADLEMALSVTSKLRADERQALTLVLIGEAQTSRSPLFQTLLLVAYSPLLQCVVARWKHNDDAESRALCGFLEAIRRVSLERPPERIALHLFGTTARLAFDDLKRAQREPATVSFDEELHSELPVGRDIDERAVRVLLSNFTERELRELLPAFVAVELEGETPREFVTHASKGLSAIQQERLEARLTRRIAVARQLLAGEEKGHASLEEEVGHAAE